METYTLNTQNFKKILNFVLGEGKKCPDCLKSPITIIPNEKGQYILFNSSELTSTFISIIQSYSLIVRKLNPSVEGKSLLAKSILLMMKKIRGDNYLFCETIKEDSSALFYATNSNVIAENYLVEGNFLDSHDLIYLLIISFATLAGPAKLSSPKKKNIPFVSSRGYLSINFILLLLTGFPADTSSSQYSIEDGTISIPVSSSQQIGLISADPGAIATHIGSPLAKPRERIWLCIYIGRSTCISFEEGCFIEYNPCAEGELKVQKLPPDSSLFAKLQALVE